MSGTEKATGFLAIRIRPWDLVVVSGVILIAATLFGFFGSLWWLLDLFSHFRVQYFLGLLLAALLMAGRRRYRVSILFAVFALANLLTILPLLFGSRAHAGGGGRSYRSLLMNVNTGSGAPEKVAQEIRRLNPDLLVLEEISESWLSTLSPVLKEYQYWRAAPRDDNFGIALYSRLPIASGGVRYVGEAEVPTLIVELDLPHGRLTVVATHPLPPAGSEYSRLRDDQLAQLSQIVSKAETPLVLLGDLNTTPWGASFKKLRAGSGLGDVAQGQRIQGTWPTFFPILLIPLDHFLHTPDVFVVRRFTGSRVGSDHYPLVVDFVPAPGLSAAGSNGYTNGPGL